MYFSKKVDLISVCQYDIIIGVWDYRIYSDKLHSI